MTKSDQIVELQKEVYLLKEAMRQQITALNYLKSEVNIVKSCSIAWQISILSKGSR